MTTPSIELVRVSDHAWEVCDCHADVVGYVDVHEGIYDVLLLGAPAWRPHFASLESATDYFEEYLDALELGVSS